MDKMITKKAIEFLHSLLDRDRDVEKSYVSRYPITEYYTIKDNNILRLGYELPIDSTTGGEESGKYALIIAREGENSWTPNITVETFDDKTSAADVEDKAITLVENNKNNVKNVLVCVGTDRLFANRSVYKVISSYQLLAKEDDYYIGDIYKPYASVGELPPAVKKLDPKKQRQWMHVWNSSYKEHGDEKRAFASAWSVVGKGQPDTTDAHVDSLDEKTCTICNKTPCECKNEVEKIEHFIELNKSSLVEGLVYGVVYEPMRKDAHGDWTTQEEIYKWAHNFLPSALSNGNWTNKNHKDVIEKHDVEVVESYIAPCDFKFPNGEPVIKGSWVLVSRVNSEELRKAIEDGEITGYSLEGVGKKVDLDMTFNDNIA